jgi:hypothetical protein
VFLNVWEQKQLLPVAQAKVIMTVSADIGPKTETARMERTASKCING